MPELPYKKSNCGVVEVLEVMVFEGSVRVRLADENPSASVLPKKASAVVPEFRLVS